MSAASKPVIIVTLEDTFSRQTLNVRAETDIRKELRKTAINISPC
jgi:hypothetical protein